MAVDLCFPLRGSNLFIEIALLIMGSIENKPDTVVNEGVVNWSPKLDDDSSIASARKMSGYLDISGFFSSKMAVREQQSQDLKKNRSTAFDLNIIYCLTIW